MMAVRPSSTPLAVFGDLDGDIWGVILGGDQPRAAVGRLTDAGIELRPVELDQEDDDVWIVSGAGCDLRLETADAAATTDGGTGVLTPCRVSGSATLDGNRREFDIGGVRGGDPTVEGADSARLFAAWFPAGHEVALVAARPKSARGHDRDGLEVVARGEEHRIVIDPRLSTTYDGEGAPRRVGVELWLGDDPDGDLFPRRVAGMATGSHVSDDSGLSAYAFECVSRGEPGAGVYLLLAR